ncbi:HlyD family secretion protein [Parapedobacter soli]|uniref:HlyD family secretion protein n=1 Tax=Parapedobacter soli TaxID=416955 RepID=UPI0021C90F25|nr:biotin/lipoyl-binding protein [Parapedobacter soli]
MASNIMIMDIFKTLTTILFAAFLFSACNRPQKTGLEGKIKRDAITVTTKVPGRVAQLRVSEGDVVKKGDTLAVLDLPEVDAKIAQAQGAVRSASAQYEMAERGATPNQLKQLQAKHDALKEQYEFARKSFTRVEAMFADSLISPQSYDEAMAKFQGARAQYDAVVAELAEAKSGVRVENKLMALGQQERASGALKEAEVASSERYIIAPADMSIETISLHIGELATPGYSIFNGYLPQTTWFRFTLAESQVARFQQGQQISVRIPYLNQSVDATVATIKQLPKYANVTTAYPDYELEEAVYEVKARPTELAQADTLLNNATVTFIN